MHAVGLPSGQADSSVAPCFFTLLKHGKRASDANKIDSSFFQCVATSFKPRVLLEDVLDNDRKTTGRQEGQHGVKIRDADPMTLAARRFVDRGPVKHVRESIQRYMQHRILREALNGLRDAGLARTRCTIKDDGYSIHDFLANR